MGSTLPEKSALCNELSVPDTGKLHLITSSKLKTCDQGKEVCLYWIDNLVGQVEESPKYEKL